MRARSFALFALLAAATGCASVAPPEASEPIVIGQPAAELKGERYLEYRVGINVAAPATDIWAILTDAPAYPSWNSTVISIDGTIAKDERIELKSTVAPDRTFGLTVSTFDGPAKMVWEDGGKAFRGVRTFTLTDKGDGTTDVTMSEVLTGIFLPSAEKKLPDFRPSFDAFASDLKTKAESGAAPPA